MSTTRFLLHVSILVAVRNVGAQLSPIMDCDETFNYWEPLHYLLYGRGLQTWEYSPAYALRSYAYLGVNGLLGAPAYLRHAAGSETEKALVFFTIRAGLGLLSAVGEALLCDAARSRFGPRVSWLTFLFLATNAGMFHASVALLPSSACMLMVLYGFAAWFSERHLLGLFCGAAAVLLCWPFSALMFVPMGLHALYARGFMPVLFTAITSLALFVGIPVLVDSALYGKPTFAIGNLILYNVLGHGGGGQGADLYGTEPWTFYLRNLILNLNLVALLAFASPVVVLALWPYQKIPKPFPTSARMVLVYLSPAFASLALFTSMPHKEERFLSMVYPVLCVGAALSAHLVLEFITGAVPSSVSALRDIIRLGWVNVVLLSCLLSVCRSAGLYVNFSAPLRVFGALQTVPEASKLAPASTNDMLTVCVGKEWYRYPSSFLLPANARVAWTRNKFRGVMPQEFSPWPNGTREVHAHFNDQNADESSAYVPVDTCDFAVDLAVGKDYGDIGDWTRGGDGKQRWEKVFCAPFMDASRSPVYIRSFYVPHFSEKRNRYAEFCLLRASQQE
ncbi:Alpha-1,2-mannosyltransferase ALG9 [Hondaea fermentalgiana]|uniref:Mannosyltransferase n=1 Tax=Hondaea fermentalgiana TaxID=2315210 RepID=A0A2R5G2D5_9STRA|nr:Alpha-1,2-mannosyltransferase ALG9 [Hondaea fermentalgiana]|eukprot:GBG23888.1 Alpha-1,2-mannosyltransferase ALG9 [Hondaea fermentalgiana]